MTAKPAQDCLITQNNLNQKKEEKTWLSGKRCDTPPCPPKETFQDPFFHSQGKKRSAPATQQWPEAPQSMQT